MDTASLILFGIRAAVRLGQASFKAYVDMTRNRDLVLPLPDDFIKPPPELAYRFFYNSRGDGRQFYDPNLVEKPIFDKPWPRIRELDKAFERLSEAEKAELVSLAQEGKRLIDATQGRRTRSIIITDSNHVILSAIQAETISQRFVTGFEFKDEKKKSKRDK